MSDRVIEYAQSLMDQAQAFELRPDVRNAKNMLVLCRCLESSITAQLIRRRLEDVSHGA